MRQIIYGCTVTNQKTVGSYNYYLYSRVDNYALILREKANEEWLVYIITDIANIDTDWANADAKSYVRPNALSASAKRFVTNKMRQFLNDSQNVVDSW
jgi:hypothetical protein